MKIPKNQIKENLYTSGNEFITMNNKSYSGYYFIANGRYFIGKIFNLTADEIKPISHEESIKINTINNLPNNLSDIIKSKIVSSSNTPANISSIPPNSSSGNFRYFYKQVNQFPILIKEINQDTFNVIRNNPLYETLIISSNSIYLNSPILEEAEKTFIGIKSFLNL
jgi:hypothetical protein